MIDEEERDLIEEIRALDRVLGEKNKIQPVEEVEDDDATLVPPVKKAKVENQRQLIEVDKIEDCQTRDYDDYEGCSQDPQGLMIDEPQDEYSKLERILELNKELINIAFKARERMVEILDECNVKQKFLQEQISRNQNPTSTNKSNFNASMPYFKDKESFPAPRNSDTEAKIRNFELRLVQLQRVSRWTKLDKRNLLKAVIAEAGQVTGVHLTESNSINKANQLTKVAKSAIQSMKNKEFDWMKIANNDFENKHSATECQVMWKLFLHPEVNKQKWAPGEDKELARIAKKFEYQDWDSIATNLDTKRSGYQCFVRYNTNNWKNIMKGQPWSQSDDECLVFLVNHLKIGDHIPWGYIASCMKNWTKQQVYFRWIYSLAPNIKKGRFSPDEDTKLLEAVAKFGENFHKISALVLPHRTHVQLKDHHLTLITKQTIVKKAWTVEDDSQLLELREEHGPNWSKIVTLLGKEVTRTQARHRFVALRKSLQKGISLQNMVRDGANENGNANGEPEIVAHIVRMTPTLQKPKTNNCEVEIVEDHTEIDGKLVAFFKRHNLEARTEDQIKNYAEKQREHNAHKLFKLLETLNAKLVLTHSSNFDLHSMDEQLIGSLQDYANNYIMTAEEKLNSYHIKMFGPDALTPAKDKYQIPLPYGCYNGRYPKSVKNHTTLDYDLHVQERHQVEVVLQFEPSRDVEVVVGEEDKKYFNKIKGVMLGHKRSSFQPDDWVDQNMFTLRCKQFAQESSFSGDDQEHILPDVMSNYRYCKYNWQLGRLVYTEEPREKLIVDRVPVNIIPPNKSTLISYQQILALTHNIPQSNFVPVPDVNLSPSGIQALFLLKKRYDQLYFMPIGMSKVIPQEVEKTEKMKIQKFQKREKKRKKLKPEDEDQDEDNDESKIQ